MVGSKRHDSTSRMARACRIAGYGKTRVVWAPNAILCAPETLPRSTAEGRPRSPSTSPRVREQVDSVNDQKWSRERRTSTMFNFANSASTCSLIPPRLSLTIAQIFLPITSLVPHPSTSLTLADATRKVPCDDNNAQNSSGSIDGPGGLLTEVSHNLDPENRQKSEQDIL